MKGKTVLKAICIALVLLAPSFAFASTAAGLFAKANAEYNKGQYAQALADYREVMVDGYQSAALYFNIGNSYYKTGDIPSAILYYEKAHKLAPGDEDISYNLKYANLKTTDRLDEVPEFFLSRWWKNIILVSSTDTLGIWSVVFILLGSGLLVLYFFAASVGVKKGAFYTAVGLFILGVFTLFIAQRQLSYFDSHHEAIVFNGTVDVKSSPAEKASTLFVIHDGTKVNVLESNNGWVRIGLVNGNQGWIKPGDVKEI
jgi:tetratricopeptide (TPR) repeat protein